LHDVRHISLTQFSEFAPLKEAMERAGHTTPTMALHYQHLNSTISRRAALAVGRPTYSEEREAGRSS
jgi:hypothetical protein